MAKQRIVTLLTDFGRSGPYAAEMTGVILNIAAGATVVDITHDIPPGDILAGARKLRSDELADTLATMKTFIGKTVLRFASFDRLRTTSSTVIGIVATNARLTKEEVNKMAQMAQDGIARAVRPAHTMFDGDTLFALATGDKRADVNLIGAYAAEVVVEAIVRGVQAATSAGGLPAQRNLQRRGH